jgi:hypothetical protein
VKVPAPIDVEFTVTVEPEPEQELVAVGEVKLEIFGVNPRTIVIGGVFTVEAPQVTVLRK